MTSINSGVLDVYLKQLAYVRREKIERKSVWDLRGVNPTLFKRAKLTDLLGNLMADYVYFVEACIKHDLEFQGKPVRIDQEMKRNNEIALADSVEDSTLKILKLWVEAQDMLFRSYSRDLIVRTNKRDSFPKKEITKFLELSEGHRLDMISAFEDAFFVSFAYLVKSLNLDIESDSDVAKWTPHLMDTYNKIIDAAIAGAKDLGVVPRKKEELWDLFEIDNLVKSGLSMFL